MNLQGMKMAVLGDSITEGAGVSNFDNLFFNCVKRDCGLRALYVDGISGTRIARQQMENNDLNFISRVDKMDSDSDLVVIFGGTNDFGHGDAPIGSPADHTPDTFWGACSVLCEMLIARFPKAKIVFMGPLHRLNEDDPCGDQKAEPVGTLYDYADILREVTKRYNLSYLDLMQISEINPKISINKDKYIPDGLHPNDAGHVLIAKTLEEFLKELV